MVTLYGYLLGLPIAVFVRLLRATCRIRFEGEERVRDLGGHILAMWHHNNLPYFVVFTRHDRPHIWLSHPAWFMRPVHVLLRRSGVEKLALGSTGHGGRGAADAVVEHLRRGYATQINPDGPNGPPLRARKGALHMAKQAGVPIVPVQITTSCALRIPSWDGKRLPLPFSKIVVRYGTSFLVEKDVDDYVALLEERLGPAARPRRGFLRCG